MSEKIDIIITWVDGSDPDWIKEKIKYNPDKNEDNRNIRYRDWDILNYWFRGIEKYMSWVNKIHFVTWGHVPSWLNLDNPKLNIVNHSDFIPSEYLPTFNSRVIELYFHKIKGLSEKFIYFNDDMFVLNQIDKKDFFRKGLPCDSLLLDVTRPLKTTYSSTVFNNIAIINSHFNKRQLLLSNFLNFFNVKYGKDLYKTILSLPWPDFSSIYNQHLPIPYLKRTFQKVWEIEEGALAETSKCKFRNNENVNHFLFRYWQMLTNNFKPSRKKGEILTLRNKNDKIFKAIKEQKYPLFCINDSDHISDYNGTKKKLVNSFNYVFPEKSSFEN